ITSGPDGNLWFTETAGNTIGKITPNGTVTEYPLPNSGSWPFNITHNPDGNLWFTEYDGSRIGKITTSGTITEYPLSGYDRPMGITHGPKGDNTIWFTEDAGNRIGRITLGGMITEYLLPTANSNPFDITVGS